MDEKQDNIVAKEVQTGSDVAQEQVQAGDNEVAKETQEQINYKALRELKDKAERERDDALNRYKQLEARSSQDNKEQRIEQPVDNFSINEDDLVEGKHLNVVDKKVKALEDKLKAYQQKSASESVEVKLKSQFPDFDKVVSQENIDILKTAYPELASAIGSSTDLYSKASSAYTLIKKFGIYKDNTYAVDVDRVKQNLAKPVPTTSLGTQQSESPLTQANAFAEGLTPELKKKLYKEMVEASK